MAKCENCAKAKMKGHMVSHAKDSLNRTFRPNLHKVSIMVKGIKTRMVLCPKCVRLLKKAAAGKVLTA
jgi:large subunit ribosomal protein L28